MSNKGSAKKRIERRFGDPLRVEVAVESLPPAEWEDRKGRIFEGIQACLSSLLSRPVEAQEIWSKNLREEISGNRRLKIESGRVSENSRILAEAKV